MYSLHARDHFNCSPSFSHDQHHKTDAAKRKGCDATDLCSLRDLMMMMKLVQHYGNLRVYPGDLWFKRSKEEVPWLQKADGCVDCLL